MAKATMIGQIYQPQEETFFDDERPDIDNLRNSPLRVLAAIDDFARTKKYLMNVGENKGHIITELIKEVRPQTMVELGAYVGYSCLLFASTLRDVSGKDARYLSLERNPEFAAVALTLVHLAGLDDVVTVMVGPSDSSLRRLHASGTIFHIDLMFLDHFKPAYTTDLKLCEELKLISPGSVLAADNVIKPGNPPYLEYAASTVKVETNGVDSRFLEATANQYLQREGPAKLSASLRGNPNLVYKSDLVHSFEPSGVPDGIEITRCVGEAVGPL
ncbi:S-adenosyl-L-methionine-dependent methyltransferase [Rhizodiscina lignyota]|uniref:catechol O-methyltransferase n=1 Tax=Rhizodiscina lignyota TaxID=1504668 RepID=A0A9P4IEJ1_9PEZI|nr:S-adenosyl-L-methionine-dependent methyltransferase [Rhizodiscina lignyota]